MGHYSAGLTPRATSHNLLGAKGTRHLNGSSLVCDTLAQRPHPKCRSKRCPRRRRRTVIRRDSSARLLPPEFVPGWDEFMFTFRGGLPAEHELFLLLTRQVVRAAALSHLRVATLGCYIVSLEHPSRSRPSDHSLRVPAACNSPDLPGRALQTVVSLAAPFRPVARKSTGNGGALVALSMTQSRESDRCFLSSGPFPTVGAFQNPRTGAQTRPSLRASCCSARARAGAAKR
jgi:hypothetical protein